MFHLPVNHVTRVMSAVGICSLLLFAACTDEDQENQAAPKLNHKNAVEYYVTTVRDTSKKLIVSTRKDIYSNYKLLSSTTVVDTLPDLGTEVVTDEDENGDKTTKDTPVAYDIYFHSERK